jgi:hypothetical protein
VSPGFARLAVVHIASAVVYGFTLGKLMRIIRPPQRGPLVAEPWTPERQAEMEARQVAWRKEAARHLAEDLREVGLVIAEAPT